MIVLDIPEAPPSLNVVAGKGGHWKYTKAKKHWHDLLYHALREAEMAPCKRVVVEGEVTFPDQRKRDQGNYRFLIEKALGDALQDGWLEDDDWDSYEFGGLAYSYEKGVARTRLLLLPEDER